MNLQGRPLILGQRRQRLRPLRASARTWPPFDWASIPRWPATIPAAPTILRGRAQGIGLAPACCDRTGARPGRASRPKWPAATRPARRAFCPETGPFSHARSKAFAGRRPKGRAGRAAAGRCEDGPAVANNRRIAPALAGRHRLRLTWSQQPLVKKTSGQGIHHRTRCIRNSCWDLGPATAGKPAATSRIIAITQPMGPLSAGSPSRST